MPGKVAQALISVAEKRGLIEFARALHERGIALLSTGGTAQALAAAGVPVTEVASHTGFPEMLDGRVKTLHPRIHAGILARRELSTHVDALTEHGIPPIDLVVVNLYPFRQTVARPGCTLEDAIENIDIGGPAMVRSAAKNWPHVGVVVDPDDYPAVLAELDIHDGRLERSTRFRLAAKAFAHTAAYDGAIANWLSARDADGVEQGFPTSFRYAGELVQALRYGENPHQRAAFYRDDEPREGGVATFRQRLGKELSYNNIADADAAWECVKSFELPACVIVKHANPCGVATALTPLVAYRKAFQTDPTSAFGGIIAFNAPVDAECVEAVLDQFAEVLIAPHFTPDALRAMERKPNVRVLEIALPEAPDASAALDMKRVGGGLLVQTADTRLTTPDELRVVTQKAPSAQQLEDLVFASRVAKFVKSNAIVFCANGQTLGIGAGQMSRVDSTRIAAMKAKNAILSLSGSVVASDAFFPFRDGIDVLAEQGAQAVIQPGGSMRDDEIVAAADEHGLAMVFTGLRHFRH